MIYADSLNMPESTIAAYIINILPEILERPRDFIASDYTVKVEDMPVGSAVDAILTQIRLCDIEKIAISESPLSSFQNNSKSGSINIILKQRDTEEKPYWGSASVDGAIPLDILPQFAIGYKKDKFKARVIALGETYNASYDTNTIEYDANGRILSNTTSSDRNKFWTNLATLFLNYKPTNKDELSLSTSFLHGNDDDEITTSEKGSQSTTNSTNNSKVKDFRTYLKYLHKFSANNEFNFEFQYNHHPTTDGVIETLSTINKENKVNDICGQLKVKLSLLSPENKYKSFLFIGSNGNASFGSSFNDHRETTATNTIVSSEKHSSYDKIRSRGLTPFIEWENYFGPFKAKLWANLLYYHYDFQREGEERMEKDDTDFSIRLMTEWQFKEGQTLRFIADHQINRPTDMQIYPYLIEDVSSNSHIVGNFNLDNTVSNNFTLDYIYNRNWGESSLLLNASGSYNHISDVISAVTMEFNNGEKIQTFDNVGKNDMLVGMLMAMYKYKGFSVTLTADGYKNSMKLKSGTDHYRYFDIMLMPTFRTRTNWMGSLRLTYFSPVDTENLRKSSIGELSFQLGKSWGNFNVHAYGGLSLGGRTKDTHYGTDGSYKEVLAHTIKNSIGMGVRYSF